jgi:thiamine-monophosphate kinase
LAGFASSVLNLKFHMDPALEALGEFGLINLIRRRVKHRSPGVLLGIGDDAAVLGVEEGHPLLLTTDLLLEGVHFQRAWGRPRDLGRKALAVNLSDIAAMGGRPLHAILGLAIPPRGASLEELDALLAGLEEEAEAYGVTVVGGDTCASSSGLVLAVTVVGVLTTGRILSRSGARPGDGLWVTGVLGGAAAGLWALERGLRPGAPWPAGLSRPAWLGPEEEEAIQAAVAAHLTPAPRLAAGQALAGWATAMIDVSDGVASDVGHLCRESDIAATVLASRLPIHPGAVALARLSGQDVLDFALRGGEDYELLFTAAADPTPVLAAAAPDLRLTRIGEVSRGPARVMLIHADGRSEPLAGGFDHFRGGAQGAIGGQ